MSPSRPRSPRVSVVMPAYNTAPYIAAAVRSALVAGEPGVEVLVIDDGSTDGTVAAVRAIDDPRVTVIETPASGGPSSRYAEGDKPEFVAGLVLKAVEEGQASISRMIVFRKMAGSRPRNAPPMRGDLHREVSVLTDAQGRLPWTTLSPN